MILGKDKIASSGRAATASRIDLEFSLSQQCALVRISVVIPCYNEQRSIRAIVEAVRDSGLENLELIVVDDGSTDGTVALLQNDCARLVDRLIVHEKNRGKGAALRSGFEIASGEIILIQDADLEYNPGDYSILLEPILSGRADVVFGSRFLGGRPHRVLYFWHMVGNRLLTLISNVCTNLNLTDMETGYKAFRAPILRNLRLEEDRFGFEPEITAKVARMKCRIYEVGISYEGRTYEEGKKIGWRDGFYALYAILKYNLLER